MQSFETTRAQLRERVTCAIDRARRDFGKRLRRRLSDMDVPAPGEIQAALDDLSLQLEQMTRRFVARTNSALEFYERELGARSSRLVPTLSDSQSRSETATRDLVLSIDNLLEYHLSYEFEFDGSWRGTSKTDDALAALRLDLLERVDAARDAMRLGTVALTTELAEERIISDDAWTDLKRRLGAVKQEAQSDCWKLDGPYLDGRFPRAARNGQVALLVR